MRKSDNQMFSEPRLSVHHLI